MSDTVSKEQRRLNMSRIKSRDTRPEKTVRSAIHRLGFRFRTHSTALPGKPDIVLRKHKTVIFVHGCFWHRHQGCKRCTTPTSNEDYWIPKLCGNVARDKLHKRALTKLGWRVLVIWECETKDVERLIRKMHRLLGAGAKMTTEK